MEYYDMFRILVFILIVIYFIYNHDNQRNMQGLAILLIILTLTEFFPHTDMPEEYYEWREVNPWMNRFYRN